MFAYEYKLEASGRRALMKQPIETDDSGSSLLYIIVLITTLDILHASGKRGVMTRTAYKN